MGPVSPHETEQGWSLDHDRFFEGVTDLFVVVDSDAVVRWLSEGWTRFARSEPGLSVDRPLTDIMHPDDATGFIAALDALIAGESSAIRARCRGHRGVWLWLRFDMACDEDGSIYCLARDDTAASAEEDELREGMRQPLLAQELAKIGFWQIDLDSGEVTWSDEAYRIRGIERGSYAPTLEGIVESYHPDDRELFMRHLEESVMTQGGFELELRVLRADGQQRTIRSLGQARSEGDKVTGLFGLTQDVTARKRSETNLVAARDELFAANDLLSGMISSTDEAILAVDADFDILIFNDAYAETVRRINGKELAVGTNLLALIEDLPEQRRQAEINFRRALGGEAFTVTRQYPSDGGETMILDLGYAPLHDDQGAIVGLSIIARDVTEQLRARQRLEESEARFRALTEESLQGMVVHRNFKPLFVNRAYARIKGFDDPDEVLSLPSLLPHIPDHVRESAIRNHRAMLRGEIEEYTARSSERRRDGTSIWVEALLRRVDWDGEPAAQVTLVDISEQIEYERQLEAERAHFRQQAITDPLTGIANRRHFLDLSNQELKRAHRYRRSVSFLIFDVDHFKQINDSHGHAAGDEALKRIPEACAGALRASDVLGRLGGEEFGVLLPRTPLRQALVVAERLRERVSRIVAASGGEPFGITVSIGVAQWRPPEETLESVLKRADTRLFQAKRAGRDRVVGDDD